MTLSKNNQKRAKPTPFLTTLTENPKPKSQVIFSVQTKRLHESFEGSNSSLAWARGELSLSAQAVSGRLMIFLQFSDFGVKCFFWVITLVPDMLEGQYRRGRSSSFKNNFKPKNGSLDWRPGPVKVGQKFNPPLWDLLPGEPLTQIKKIFNRKLEDLSHL